MSRDELRKTILEVLATIAPEIEPTSIEPARLLREQIDLDSADWLNLLLALNSRLGIDIPDADVGRLTTLDRLVDYCERRA